MFNRLSKNLSGVLALSVFSGVFSLSAWAQAPKAPAVKDQGEYDLTQAVTKETDPVKKLDLLNQWDQKYPDSDFKGTRSLTIMSTELQLATAGAQPGASAAAMDNGKKYGQMLIDNLDKFLSDANKPATATADQWKEAKTQIPMQAYTAVATIDMNRKTPAGDAAAETEFKKLLELNPNNASASYTLGTLILRLKNIARYPEALYYIARAIDDSGPLALNAAGKTAAQTFLKRAYNGYHGSDDGLDELMKTASASAIPPSGFTIESVTDIQKKQEGDAAAFAAAHPDIALWRTIRAALTAADGDAYFGQVKGSEVPPQEADAKFKMFPGKVVEVREKGKELLVNVDSPVGDAVLQFESPLKGEIQVGTEIKFKGVIDAFTKEPYALTFTGLGKEDVEGLPASAFAAAAPRRPRPATKKK